MFCRLHKVVSRDVLDSLEELLHFVIQFQVRLVRVCMIWYGGFIKELINCARVECDGL